MGMGEWGRAAEEVNEIQKIGSRPLSVIKGTRGPQLVMLHSGPCFFFVNRDVLSQ